jgi:hypothetical protein
MVSMRASDPRTALRLPFARLYDTAVRTSLPPDRVSASSAQQTNVGDRPPLCSTQSTFGHSNDGTTPTRLGWPDRHPAQEVIAKVDR